MLSRLVAVVNASPGETVAPSVPNAPRRWRILRSAGTPRSAVGAAVRSFPPVVARALGAGRRLGVVPQVVIATNRGFDHLPRVRRLD